MQSGDTRFYKHPDRWGSPIEKATIITVGERSSVVKVGHGHTIVPNYMLFKYACDASEWAERQVKSISNGIFGDYNAKMRQSDYDFSMKKPVVEAKEEPTRYVVCEDVRNSMVLVDSYEAALATQDWLRRTTGQWCTIRPVKTHTLPKAKATNGSFQ